MKRVYRHIAYTSPIIISISSSSEINNNNCSMRSSRRYHMISSLNPTNPNIHHNTNNNIINNNNINNNNNIHISTLYQQRRTFRKELFEGPLDLKPGERTSRKGPPVSHSLPVYKTAHKLNSSVRWKNANLIANVAGGKDYRLRETQGEGTFDESGMYRDWLYGDERRYANYIGALLGCLSIGLFFYTMRVMGSETWDIPAPVLASQRKKAGAVLGDDINNNNNNNSDNNNNNNNNMEVVDALAMLKRPAIVSKSSS